MAIRSPGSARGSMTSSPNTSFGVARQPVTRHLLLGRRVEASWRRRSDNCRGRAPQAAGRAEQVVAAAVGGQEGLAAAFGAVEDPRSDRHRFRPTSQRPSSSDRRVVASNSGPRTDALVQRRAPSDRRRSAARRRKQGTSNPPPRFSSGSGMSERLAMSPAQIDDRLVRLDQRVIVEALGSGENMQAAPVDAGFDQALGPVPGRAPHRCRTGSAERPW